MEGVEVLCVEGGGGVMVGEVGYITAIVKVTQRLTVMVL